VTDTRQTQSDDLPEGWMQAELGHFIESMANGIYKPESFYAPEGFPCLRMYNIQDGEIVLKKVKRMRLTAEEIEQYQLLEGDILVNRVNSRELVGKAAICGAFAEPTIFESKNIRLRLKRDVVNPKYVNYLLLSNPYRQHLSDGSKQTVGMATVSQPHLRALLLPFPPLKEQERIVCRLESLLARVSAARERLAKVPAILKRFRQSVLAAACSGRLTADWRDGQQDLEEGAKLLERLVTTHEKAGHGHGGKAANPSEEAHTLAADEVPPVWAIAELRWLCEPGRPITYGILKPGPDQTVGISYVRVADFPKDVLNLDTIRKTSPQIADQYRRSSLLAGDVLLSIRGTVGRTCRVPKELEGANITQDTARITVHHDLCADYIQLSLKAPGAQDRMRRAVKGVAVRGINIGDVRVLQIPLPSVPEQHEIVRRVEALFRLADAIEKRVAAATARAERLTQAILAKAFRGELVPTEAELARAEGSDYEPASALLERIRAANDQTGNKTSRPHRRIAKGLR
jgi:type I restriction enzyme S subunit